MLRSRTRTAELVSSAAVSDSTSDEHGGREFRLPPSPRLLTLALLVVAIARVASAITDRVADIDLESGAP